MRMDHAGCFGPHQRCSLPLPPAALAPLHDSETYRLRHEALYHGGRRFYGLWHVWTAGVFVHSHASLPAIGRI